MPTLKEICVFSAKGIAWMLYAQLLEFSVNVIMDYVFRKPKPKSECDAVFFTEKNRKCQNHVIHKLPCGDDCSVIKMRKILQYMERAEKTLDICIHQLTSTDVFESILKAHERGVKTRIICDGYRAFGSGSQILKLKGKGLPIRGLVSTSFDMHHKFFIQDRKTIVNCSFNWTTRAFCGNSEDAVISSKHEYIKVFAGHFDALWNSLPENWLSIVKRMREINF